MYEVVENGFKKYRNRAGNSLLAPRIAACAVEMWFWISPGRTPGVGIEVSLPILHKPYALLIDECYSSEEDTLCLCNTCVFLFCSMSSSLNLSRRFSKSSSTFQLACHLTRRLS